MELQQMGQSGVPVITAGDEVIVGFDRPRLEALAERYAAPQPAIDPSQRPKIGLRVKDASGGAEVALVHPGSAAEKGGVRVGDAISELNGRTVSSAAELEQALATLTPGGTVAVEVRREGRQRRLRVPLE
jgi:S1-C subfamily serine protease